MSPASLVDAAIAEHKVVVFSKTTCGYCNSAKRLLDSKHVSYKVFELNNRNDGAEIQDYLAQKTGQYTVPSIFIKRSHIGGSSDLSALNSRGKLDALLV
ncbi:glutaredoxin [Batrachochytrium salamandrivorans]|nr:glutaredoxin [Batrachochytrium salamandrivorans]